MFNTQGFVENVTAVYVDEVSFVNGGQYVIDTVSNLEQNFAGEISNEYHFALALNPEIFFVEGKTIYTVRVVASGFEDVIQEFHYIVD